MLSHIDDRLKEWSGWVTEKRQQRNELLHHTACAIQPTSRWFARSPACNDPAESAQFRPLIGTAQRVFSCPELGEASGCCKTESSLQ